MAPLLASSNNVNCRVNKALKCAAVRDQPCCSQSPCGRGERGEKDNIGVRLHYSLVVERGRSIIVSDTQQQCTHHMWVCHKPLHPSFTPQLQQQQISSREAEKKNITGWKQNMCERNEALKDYTGCLMSYLQYFTLIRLIFLPSGCRWLQLVSLPCDKDILHLLLHCIAVTHRNVWGLRVSHQTFKLPD